MTAGCSLHPVHILGACRKSCNTGSPGLSGTVLDLVIDRSCVFSQQALPHPPPISVALVYIPTKDVEEFLHTHTHALLVIVFI